MTLREAITTTVSTAILLAAVCGCIWFATKLSLSWYLVGALLLAMRVVYTRTSSAGRKA